MRTSHVSKFEIFKNLMASLYQRKHAIKAHALKTTVTRTFPALTIAAFLSPLAATASDGMLSFGGALSTATCNITGPASFTVTLPTVAQTSFASIGVYAGTTQFSIALTGCTMGLTGANVFFESGPDVGPDAARGGLINRGTAGNVHLRLEDHKRTNVYLNFPVENYQYEYYVDNIESGAARLDFYVSYYATGPVTPGTVNSSITYSMFYN